MHQKQIQEAWREKVALCVSIVILCAALAFLTFGFSIFVCTPPKNPVYKYELVREANDPLRRRFFMIHGQIYNVPAAAAKKIAPHGTDVFAAFATQDISIYFPFSPTCPAIKFTCRSPGSSVEHCHPAGMLNKLDYIGEVAFEWKDVERPGSNLLVHNGEVLDLSVYFDQVPAEAGSKPFGAEIDGILREYLGRDASKALAIYDTQTIDCLFEHFRAGQLQVKTMGCVATDIVLYVSLLVILSLVFAKFFLAIGFAFVMARRLGRPPADNDLALRRRKRQASSEKISREQNHHHHHQQQLQQQGGEGEIDDNGILSSALKSSRYAAAKKVPNRYSESSHEGNGVITVC
jgi:chitin synthase